ncbi:hypothetical protein [Arcobacter roscoffensis]|uniref:Sensor histidine kinase n=1 Tax=Arcobacter roscoffensis TaxID=2961520 RepID=A0ABY5E7I3_9BACT|nr:hypothetical protein [Arcobacter roscoffensis]UTJ07479.1 hypothetical protein NJU99_05125 [Arcobacter roscoffensis]
MNIPNIPTDNLYKFLSISSMLITIFFFVIPLYLKHEIDIKIIYLTGEMDLIEKKISITSNDLDILDKLAQTEDKQSLKYIELEKEIKKNNLVNENSLNEIRVKSTLIAYYKKNLFYLAIISFIILFVSIPMTFIGFRLWYIKIQKPLDTELYTNLKC